MTDAEVMKFTGFRKPQSSEVIEQCLEKWIQEGSQPLGVWCAEESNTKDFVGWFMLKKNGHQYPELGFMLPRHKWGKGFATEISERFLEYAFTQLRYKKVLATTVSDNLPSISVLKKIGMVQSEINSSEDPDYKILCFERLSNNP